MSAPKLFIFLLISTGLGWNLQAQCDPDFRPTGLTESIPVPGGGVLLQWDAVPGSDGVKIRIESASAGPFDRVIVGPADLDRYLVPYQYVVGPGPYTWRVLAACFTLTGPPFFESTRFSEPSTFYPPFPFVLLCGAVTDIDGNTYNMVEIGDQCWMNTNLKVEHYLNGDAIPTGLSGLDWSTTTSGAFAVYDNNPANKFLYGLLYNWFAVADSRGLCPEGTHIPSDEEWTALTDYLGGGDVAGGKMKSVGTLSTGTGLWLAPNRAATNSSGFIGLPGGGRANVGFYGAQELNGIWWSSTESPIFPNSALGRILSYDDGVAGLYFDKKRAGSSVRCLRD